MIVIEYTYCELGGKTDHREAKKKTHFDQKCPKLGHFWVPHWVTRSVTLVLECHFISLKLRQVSRGCIPRVYMLWIGQKWNSVGQDLHFISKGETNFGQDRHSIIDQGGWAALRVRIYSTEGWYPFIVLTWVRIGTYQNWTLGCHPSIW